MYKRLCSYLERVVEDRTLRYEHGLKGVSGENDACRE